MGKSVLFNALTGAYVTVSNYPGTSVEVSRGAVTIDGIQCEIIDTPGMYALLPITEEERVAREILLNESPDLIIHVLDARNLERMLAMTLQLIEAGLPVLLVVNIMDEAERMGIGIDIPLLQEKLGIPVIGAATAKKRGLTEIRRAIVSHEREVHAVFGYSRRLENDIERDGSAALAASYRLSRKALALLLLQGDEEVAELVKRSEGEKAAAVAEQVKTKRFERRESFHMDLSMERKAIVHGLLSGVIRLPDQRRVTFAERLSTLAVRPLTGVPLLLIVLYFGLYKFVGDFGAGTLVDLLEEELFEGMFNPWITDSGQGDHPLGGYSGAVRRRVRGHHPWPPLRSRHHPPDRRHLLPLLLPAGGQRLFPPSGAAGRPALQKDRPHRPGGHPDGARFRLRYHGHHGDPDPGDGAGADHRHPAAGPGHPLFRPAGGHHGAAVKGPRRSAGLELSACCSSSWSSASLPPD